MTKKWGIKEVLITVLVASAGLGFKFADHLSNHNNKLEWDKYLKAIEEKDNTLKNIFSES